MFVLLLSGMLYSCLLDECVHQTMIIKMYFIILLNSIPLDIVTRARIRNFEGHTFQGHQAKGPRPFSAKEYLETGNNSGALRA